MIKLINGPKNSITDIDGFLVGNAHDDHIKSGVTVLTRSTAFRASVSILGGAPGTKETDLLSPDKVVESIDAIVLARTIASILSTTLSGDSKSVSFVPGAPPKILTLALKAVDRVKTVTPDLI